MTKFVRLLALDGSQQIWRGLWREAAAQVKDLLFIHVEKRKDEIRFLRWVTTK